MLREQVVSAVADRLRQISTSNGYSADINVFVWKDTPFSADQLPALNLRDESSDVEEHTNVSEIIRLNFRLDVVVAGGDPVRLLRAIMRDVRKVIGKDETFGGLVLYTRMVGDEIDTVTAEEKMASALMRFYTVYEIPRWGM